MDRCNAKKIKTLKENRWNFINSKRLLKIPENINQKIESDNLDKNEDNITSIKDNISNLEIENDKDNINENQEKVIINQLLIEQIFEGKNKANEYEINLSNFTEILIDGFGDFFIVVYLNFLKIIKEIIYIIVL